MTQHLPVPAQISSSPVLTLHLQPHLRVRQVADHAENRQAQFETGAVPAMSEHDFELAIVSWQGSNLDRLDDPARAR